MIDKNAADFIESALRNWGRWARLNGHQGHCASIEFRYTSPQCWRDLQDQAPRVEIDHALAESVERTMRHIPRLHRLALKFRYVYGEGVQWCCRRLRLPYDGWGRFLADAQSMVLRRLQLENNGSILHKIQTPSKDAPMEPNGSVAIAKAA